MVLDGCFSVNICDWPRAYPKCSLCGKVIRLVFIMVKIKINLCMNQTIISLLFKDNHGIGVVICD